MGTNLSLVCVLQCQQLNGEITDIFRDKMNYLEHVEALRMFVLMEQVGNSIQLQKLIPEPNVLSVARCFQCFQRDVGCTHARESCSMG